MRHSRREFREEGVKLLLERLLAGIATPSPDALSDEFPVPIEIGDDWSLYTAMHPDEAPSTSIHTGEPPFAEPACGRRSITIRIPNRVLLAFRRQSERTGTAYQTQINRALQDAAEAFT